MVWTRFGINASFKIVAIEPEIFISFAKTGFLSVVKPRSMLLTLSLISDRDRDNERIAMISDAAEIIKPSSLG